MSGIALVEAARERHSTPEVDLLATYAVETTKALCSLRDAFLSLSQHGTFNHTIDREWLWRPALNRAYELVGESNVTPPLSDYASGLAEAFGKTKGAVEIGALSITESLSAFATSAEGKCGPWAINGVGFGYVVGAVQWLEVAIGPEFVSEKLYIMADLMAGRAADARVKTGPALS